MGITVRQGSLRINGAEVSAAARYAQQAAESAAAAGLAATAAERVKNAADVIAGTAVENRNEAERFAIEAKLTARKYPVVIDGTWHVWDAAEEAYVSTGTPARGERGERGERGATGETGPAGRSAYEAAQAGGFSGTEAQFNSELADIGGNIPAGLYLTGASVGDLVRVNAVDADGKPTSWKRAPLCEIAANPNLLDNGYFVGGGSAGQFPINQRGQASYGNAGYGIDRWKITASGRGTAAVNSDCIRLTKTSASGGGSFQVEQTLEREVSGPLTLSALIRSSGSACSISIRDANAGNLAAVNDTVSSSLHLVQATCSGSGNPAKTIRIAWTSAAEADSYVEVIAIKLEIGSEQTLAHQENGAWVLNEVPNYQQELAKCQRFFQIFRTQSLRPTYGTDFRPVMASETPVLDSFTVDAVTYYSASSEP